MHRTLAPQERIARLGEVANLLIDFSDDSLNVHRDILNGAARKPQWFSQFLRATAFSVQFPVFGTLRRKSLRAVEFCV